MPNHASHRHHLHLLGAHHLSKAYIKISVRSLEDFLGKGWKNACLIILINPSYKNSSLEKNIFDLQITIPRVHPVQISSCSDYHITTDIMWETQKMLKNE